MCVDLGDRNRAENLYKLLSPYSSRNAVLGYVYCYGSVYYALGRLAALIGRLDEAAEHFEAAIAANRKIGAVTWVAHTEFEYGALLLQRAREGDRPRALELLRLAGRTAQALEIVRLKKKMESIQIDTGIAESGGLAASDDGKNNLRENEPEAKVEIQSPAQKPALEAIEELAEAAITESADPSTYGGMDGTVTILFSDIEDSSALFDKLGDLRAQEIIRAHNEIIREQVARHRGKEIKTMGDGFMVVFSSARRAVLCAITIQRAFARYDGQHSDTDKSLRVRMGLHADEPIRESADFSGKAVIIAARIAALARGGEILVSSTLYDLIESAGDLRFGEGKQMVLKGLSGTHHIYPVVWS